MRCVFQKRIILNSSENRTLHNGFKFYFVFKRRGKIMYQEIFRERLVALRHQKHISARDMSISLGQSDSYINKIENGKSLPSMTAFFSICEYLGITPKDFFDEDSLNPERLCEIITNLKKMDNVALMHLSEIVKMIVNS